MRLRLTLLLACSLPALSAHAQNVPSNTGACLNAQESELVTLVNSYRLANGLPAVPVSYWVSSTAQWHVWDLTANNPVTPSCNVHSWSNSRPSLWSPVCYSNGPGSQMWNKPRQVSANLYSGNGYENAAWGGGTISALTAISLWQQSSAHADVILNRGVWASKVWRGMGVGIVGNYAVLWFGDSVDAAGGMSACSNAPVDPLFREDFE